MRPLRFLIWEEVKKVEGAGGGSCVQECACVRACAFRSTYFLTFLTFMLAVLLLQERMRGSVLSSGISALLA